MKDGPRKPGGKIQLTALFGEQIHLTFATTNCFPEISIARKFFFSLLEMKATVIQLDDSEALCPGG